MLLFDDFSYPLTCGVEIVPSNYFLSALSNNFYHQETASPQIYFEQVGLEVKPFSSCYESNPSLSITPHEQIINRLITPTLSKSYSTSNIIGPRFVLVSTPSKTEEEQIEREIARVFERIVQIFKIYIYHDAEITNVKVLINFDHYDYDLMDKIFNEAEFPIKDLFTDKLIHFEYIPIGSEQKFINPELEKLIYNKSLIENITINEKIDHSEYDDYLFQTKSPQHFYRYVQL